MAELIAQGERPVDHWRRPLTSDRPFILGRAAGEWGVPWEQYASGSHAEATWADDRLRVRRLPAARNPLFFRGEEADTFEAQPGECFAIGSTTFTLLAESGSSTDLRPVLRERSVAAGELQNVPFRDAPHRLDVLRRLPAVIVSAADDSDLSSQLVNLLLAGIPRADMIALVSTIPPSETSPEGAEKAGDVITLYWERRRFEGAEFRPSRRLVHEAVTRQQRTVLHVWAARATDSDEASTVFTVQGDFDWAFCTPVRGESCPGWGLYAAGRFTADLAASVAGPLTESELADDLKFAELTADILGALRQVRKLQRDQARLSQFFSPAVQKVLTTADPEAALRPQEADVTVMFCDLRGFSHTVEAEADHLLHILERVSQALGVMTQNIFEHHGVVADFLGDAALGFWGWPLADPDMVRQACHAALGIRRYYEALANRPRDPLAGFRVGIGVATGRAVAGRIGPHEQAKVTVFGPVVNLASRLESMTKQLRVPILIDEPTARAVRERISPSVARVRRLAKIRPYGLETPLIVSELLVPQDGNGLSDADLANYERALDAFLVGDWDRAFEALHLVTPRDRGKDILTGYIIAHNHIAPAGWDGVIELGQK
jgi:adenylate cyclase